MLRILLLIIALLIVISLALIGTGVINFSQSGEGVRIEKRDVEVGTTVKNVQVPVVRMENREVEVPSVGVENAVGNAQ